jgi:translation initiation factor 2B subunit (eIF-2B alpha/beta/delta family)
MITAVAKRKNVPVIVACEGYKFCEKVQVDSIVYNELGSPQEIAIAAKGADGTNMAVPQTEAGYRGTASPITSSRHDDADQASLPFQVRLAELFPQQYPWS